MARGSVTVVMDEAAVDLFRSWEGPLGRSINRLAKETLWRGTLLAPVGSAANYAMASTIPYKKPPHPPGRLKAGMNLKKGHWAKGISFEVGTDAKYALYVHEGTKPHTIKVRRAKALVFWWPRIGRIVHFESVKHPGTRANPWLTRALERAMRMWQHS